MNNLSINHVHLNLCLTCLKGTNRWHRPHVTCHYYTRASMSAHTFGLRKGLCLIANKVEIYQAWFIPVLPGDAGGNVRMMLLKHSSIQGLPWKGVIRALDIHLVIYFSVKKEMT